MNKTLLAIDGILAVALVALAVAYHNVRSENIQITNNSYPQVQVNERQQNMNYVLAMCNESRVYDTVSEEMCGELQDYYSVEFMCDNRNKEINNPCWVEEI